MSDVAARPRARLATGLFLGAAGVAAVVTYSHLYKKSIALRVRPKVQPGKRQFPKRKDWRDW
jgi:hypothetical protein